MWMVARYLPVAPFSLKPAAATSSGGKTLLAPTPYAIKMALLDAAIRTRGLPEGERLFPALRDLSIALALPPDLVVMKGFSKIRRPVESKEAKKTDETQEAFEARKREREAERLERGQYPLYSTIAYREYVYYREPFQLAIAARTGATLPDELPHLLMSINYFGKRGGFFQVMELPRQEEELTDERFIHLTAERQASFSVHGVLQPLDDCGSTLTFQRANVYGKERVTMGKERILRHIVLPYRLHHASRSYSWYRALEPEQEESLS